MRGQQENGCPRLVSVCHLPCTPRAALQALSVCQRHPRLHAAGPGCCHLGLLGKTLPSGPLCTHSICFIVISSKSIRSVTIPALTTCTVVAPEFSVESHLPPPWRTSCAAVRLEQPRAPGGMDLPVPQRMSLIPDRGTPAPHPAGH